MLFVVASGQSIINKYSECKTLLVKSKPLFSQGSISITRESRIGFPSTF